MSYISAPARPVEFALAYWQGTPQGYLSPIIYSAPAHGVVTEADAHFAAWVATGNLPIAWPWDETGTVTVAALDAVLANCGLPASGLAPATPAQLFGYDAQELVGEPLEKLLPAAEPRPGDAAWPPIFN